ncbi:putative toxin-antitoxin system toxin component, PIN family [Patescibacteria group bacterium]|nr:putative toxin-antitoxin system toxin component, PIN family [Patescibacteria group bacterium]
MLFVLDTNVIVSALFWGGNPREVLEKIYLKHTICFSEETLNELKEVLKYPQFSSHIENLSFSIEEFINTLTKKAYIISNPPELSIIKEDKSDNKFLACALACQAFFIISGDKHLIKVKKFKNISIITPQEFLKKKDNIL